MPNTKSDSPNNNLAKAAQLQIRKHRSIPVQTPEIDSSNCPLLLEQSSTINSKMHNFDKLFAYSTKK